MIDRYKLKGKIAEKQKTQKEVADALEISEKSLYNKLNSGIFTTEEMKKLIKVLRLTKREAIDIFLREIEGE